MKSKRFDLRMIEWIDSVKGMGWTHLDDVSNRPVECTSVGWVILEDDQAVTITGHLGEDPDQSCGEITIPKSAIVKISKVKIDKT